MLCRRSASLTMMTRMSSTMASSILRKLSAWRSSAEKKSSLLSLVTPSTQRATSSPNSLRTCSTVTLVSSTTSCSSPVSMADHVHAHVGQDVRHHERDAPCRARRNRASGLRGIGGRSGRPFRAGRDRPWGGTRGSWLPARDTAVRPDRADAVRDDGFGQAGGLGGHSTFDCSRRLSKPYRTAVAARCDQPAPAHRGER